MRPARLLTTAAVLMLAMPAAADDDDNVCSETAETLRSGCINGANDDYFLSKAICMNLAPDDDDDEVRDCLREARRDRRAAGRECAGVEEARKDVCAAVGEDAYLPAFGEAFADRFIDPRTVGDDAEPNAYFPLVPGAYWVYEKTIPDEDGTGTELERTTLTVTDRTKLIDGIHCLVVNDVVEIVQSSGNELIEDTDDWYAQDIDGNVFYCGEIAQDFEFFDGDEPELAELVDIGGSWKAGRDGAKAGIAMRAHPEIGVTERQEVAWNDAEDVFEIVSLTGTESSPAASCAGDCLITRDFSGLGGGVELKYYKPGVGRILETNAAGRRNELVEFSIP